MIEFSRCPKCATLYDLRTLNISQPNETVQCGECDHKFKVSAYEVKYNEISFHEPEKYKKSSKDKKSAKDSKQQKINLDTFESTETHSSEQTVTMEVETSEDDYAEFLDELLEPEMVVKSIQPKKKAASVKYDQLMESKQGDVFSDLDDQLHQDLESTEIATKRPVSKKSLNGAASEFSDEEINFKPKVKDVESASILDQMLEEKSVLESKSSGDLSFVKLLSVCAASIIALALAALFAFQLHSRGTYEWLKSDYYDKLITSVPFLSKLEKEQYDLSKLHLASVQMVKIDGNAKAKRIVLQMVNRSRLNQAFPDIQVEFTNEQNKVVARRLILPSTYLAKGHLGVLEAKEAKKINLDFASLPELATGYEIKIVKQSS